MRIRVCNPAKSKFQIIHIKLRIRAYIIRYFSSATGNNFQMVKISRAISIIIALKIITDFSKTRFKTDILWNDKLKAEIVVKDRGFSFIKDIFLKVKIDSTCPVISKGLLLLQ